MNLNDIVSCLYNCTNNVLFGYLGEKCVGVENKQYVPFLSEVERMSPIPLCPHPHQSQSRRKWPQVIFTRRSFIIWDAGCFLPLEERGLVWQEIVTGPSVPVARPAWLFDIFICTKAVKYLNVKSENKIIIQMSCFYCKQKQGNFHIQFDFEQLTPLSTRGMQDNYIAQGVSNSPLRLTQSTPLPLILTILSSTTE